MRARFKGHRSRRFPAALVRTDPPPPWSGTLLAVFVAPEAGAPINGVVVVIGIDDADARYAAALEQGGAEAMAPYDMPGVGRLAYFRDPDGNVMGLISDVLSDGSDVRAEAPPED